MKYAMFALVAIAVSFGAAPALAVECPVSIAPGPTVIATCPDAVAGLSSRDLDRAMALSAAASMPVWLGDSEKGRISGGTAFTDSGEFAIGATGVFRINKNVAGFVGAATDDGAKTFLGKAGISVGW